MSFQRSLRALLFSSLVLAGCGTEPIPSPEPGDTSEVPTPTPPRPGPEANADADAPGLELVDSGTPSRDAGGPAVDAGAPALDAGSPDAGAPDAGAPDASSEVRGSLVQHYRTDLADFSRPLDPTSPELQAFTFEGGVTRALRVVTSPEGTFRVPDAPVGPYFLRYGSLYLHTDSRAVNLDRYTLGRLDAQTYTTPPPATLTAHDLAPDTVDHYSVWQAISSNVGASAYLDQQEPIPAGATSVYQLPISYSQYYPTPPMLVDASRGDYQYVTQSVDRNNGVFLYSAVDRFFTQGGSLREDVPFAFEGVLRQAQPRTLVFEWWRSRFEAYKYQVHPRATRSSQVFSVSPTAWSADDWYGYLGDLMSSEAIQGVTDERLTFSYGNPYPFSWGEVLTLSHRFTLGLLLPGTTSGSLSEGLSDTRPLKDLSRGPIAPRISPAQNVTVDGLDAQQERTLGSLTPRIAWKAPLVGTPSAYRVRILRLYADGSRTRSSAVAYISTKATSVTLPPGILQPGQKYVFVVISFLTPGVDLSIHPLVLEKLTDVADADAVSSIHSAPATLAPAHHSVAPEPSRFEGLEFKLPRHSPHAR